MGKRLEIRCIHGPSGPNFQEATCVVSFPIYQTATFGHLELE